MPSALLGPLGTLARTSTVHASFSSQGRAGQHRDAQTHRFFAECYAAQSTRGQEKEMRKSSFHGARITKSISQANCCR